MRDKLGTTRVPECAARGHITLSQCEGPARQRPHSRHPGPAWREPEATGQSKARSLSVVTVLPQDRRPGVLVARRGMRTRGNRQDVLVGASQEKVNTDYFRLLRRRKGFRRPRGNSLQPHDADGGHHRSGTSGRRQNVEKAVESANEHRPQLSERSIQETRPQDKVCTDTKAHQRERGNTCCHPEVVCQSFGHRSFLHFGRYVPFG